jgi:hypothetical protein
MFNFLIFLSDPDFSLGNAGQTRLDHKNVQEKQGKLIERAQPGLPRTCLNIDLPSERILAGALNSYTNEKRVTNIANFALTLEVSLLIGFVKAPSKIVTICYLTTILTFFCWLP